MEEEIMTHTGSTVTAKETLAMESGKDIDIKGSKAGGKKVEVKTGIREHPLPGRIPPHRRHSGTQRKRTE